MRMKIILITVILSFSNVNAQIINNYGFKFGIVSSQMDVTLNQIEYVGFGTNDFYEDRRTGVTIGGFLFLFESKNLNFETEFLYYEEGAEDRLYITNSESPAPIDEISWDHEYNFLKLGINARPTYNIGNSKISLILGPTINYLVKNRDDFYLNEKIKDIHFGYNLGIGCIISDIITQPILIELKYNNYFDDFVNNSLVNANMRSFNINVGVLLK